MRFNSSDFEEVPADNDFSRAILKVVNHEKLLQKLLNMQHENGSWVAGSVREILDQILAGHTIEDSEIVQIILAMQIGDIDKAENIYVTLLAIKVV